MNELVHWLASCLGHTLGAATPSWVHPLLHVVLVWMPVGMIGLAVCWGIRIRKQCCGQSNDPDTAKPMLASALPTTVFKFIARYSGAAQIRIICAGLVMMPILYVTLELPKLIVNGVISPKGGTHAFPMEHFGVSLYQTGHLVALCILYLFSILVGGALKYFVNLYRGRVAERLLRRLRLTLFRRWVRGAGKGKRLEAIPLIAQEVEPIGGFAVDAFALPVIQGGTFLTIVTFMFVQDPILGAAALALLPVQLLVIPRLQRRVNELARQRVREVRGLGGLLGEHVAPTRKMTRELKVVANSFQRIEVIRRDMLNWKYFMKAVNNFLTALTPFFFYGVGGYLVIEGRLSLGALIAVLAAYKDFSAPLRELFRYYETAEDVRVRYNEILLYLNYGMPLPEGTVSLTKGKVVDTSDPAFA